MHLTYRRTCRVCGSAALTPVIDLGSQHIQGVFAKPGEPLPPQRTVPLTLVRCDPQQDEHACGLLQTSLTVPPEILYFRYWYRSGINTTMREHLAGIAAEVRAVFPQDDAGVLDIGCNDGTLLRALPPEWRRVGIDPSDALLEVPEDITTVRDTFPSAALHGTFDAVIAIAMFYDLEDPVAFASAVHEHLAPQGLFVFEQAYMPAMLQNNSFDTICHEHLEYYSLAVIETVLREAALKVVRVQQNDSNGGSLRVWAAPEKATKWDRDEWRASVGELRRREFDLGLDTDQPYLGFQRRIEFQRDRLAQIVQNGRAAGKRIHVYGASTKGNTILQFAGLDARHIEYAADRNPDKWGARTVGSDIPIVSEEDSRAMRPDFYLVLPWHFRKEFLVREAETMRRGTALIFPLPELEVVRGTIAAEEAESGAPVAVR